ncbi:MAG TPA: hypothetical protein VIF09_27030 [Polyangiaceae bacterium]
MTDEVLLGVDENGLGPRLGPLVVTAVVARASGSGVAKASSRPKGALRKRLDDSKKLVSFKDNALGEAWARAIARRTGLGDAKTADELIHLLSMDGPAALRAPCPGDHLGQCWDPGDEPFQCDAKLLAKVERDLEALGAAGVDVVRGACVVTCTRRLNEGVAKGLTRFHTDLHAMERLVLDARERVGCEVTAVCGKVGGFNQYSPAFGPLAGRLHAVVVEGRARSEYSFPGLGRLAFVRDADAKHLLVSMASLVGKWVRDVLMARIVRYHRVNDVDLPEASGYHDPVTARFVAATRLSRKKHELPDDCFERKAWGRENAAGRAGGRGLPG